MVVNMKDYLLVRDVAQQLDVTQDWVRDLIQTKQLKATKIGKWRIKPDDLVEFVRGRSNQSSAFETKKRTASHNLPIKGPSRAFLQVSYAVRDPKDILGDDAHTGIQHYLERIKGISNKTVLLEEHKLGPKALSEKVFDIIVGSVNTRRGPKPTDENKKVILERIRYWIERNKPIETNTSWGPHKHVAPGEHNVLDVSELSTIERFHEIDQQVKSFYPQGMHFIIFLEDFEGGYIEGDHLDTVRSMQEYMRSFMALVTILGLNEIISVITTSSIPKNDTELLQWKNILRENFGLIKDYWTESEAKGLQGAQDYASHKALREAGFFGIIDRRIRDYYLTRMDRLFGDNVSDAAKLEMVLKDFAVALFHKRTQLFSEPKKGNKRIKISLVPLIPGTPQKILKGRIDLRSLTKKDSKLCMPPWTGKGYLRVKENAVRPAMRSFREPLPEDGTMVRGRITLRRGDLQVHISADYLGAGFDARE